MTFSKESLLAALARPAVEVDVPEIGGSVYVRELSVRERMAFNKRCFGEDGKGTVSPQAWVINLVTLTLSDADGNRIMTDDDAEALWDQSELKIVALAKAAEKVNGFGRDAAADEEKNSPTTARNT